MDLYNGGRFVFSGCFCAISDKQVEVTFSTAVSEDTTEDNFSVSDRTVTGVEVDGKTVTLTLNSALTDGTEYEVNAADVYNASNTEKLDSYTGTVTYQVADVESVTFNKTDYRANVGVSVKDYVTVLDTEGRTVSMEDYQITDVESKNDSIVASGTGDVKDAGSTQVRVQVEYKNGEKVWSDWTDITVEGVAIAGDVAYGLIAHDATAPENSVEFQHVSVDTSLYNDDTTGEKLVLFKDLENGDSMGHHIDFSKVDYEVNTPNLISASVNTDGTLQVKGLNNGQTGTASITVEGEVEVDGVKHAFNETVTFEVKAASVLDGIKSFDKVTLVPNELGGAIENDYTTLANVQTQLDSQTGMDVYGGDNDAHYEAEVDYTQIDVKSAFLDQYGDSYSVVDGGNVADNTSAQVNNASQWTLPTTDGSNNGKIVVSVPQNVADVFAANGGLIKVDDNGLLTIASPDTVDVPKFDVTVSYFEDADSTEKTHETNIPVEVAKTDGEIDSFEFYAQYKNSGANVALDDITLDAADPRYEGVTFTAAALDRYGNVLTYQATDLTEIIVDDSHALTDEEKEYTTIDEATVAADTAGTTGVGFATDADNYFGTNGDAKVKVVIEDGDDTVHATEVVTIGLTTSNPVPTSVELPTEVTVDLSDAKAAAGKYPSLLDILNGVISKEEMVLDKLDPSLADQTANTFAIAPKSGLDGYVNGLEPLIKVYDQNGDPVPFGANAYGLKATEFVSGTTGSGADDVIYGPSASPLEFGAGDVTVSNVDTGLLINSAQLEQANLDFNDPITLKDGVEKASATFVIGEYKLGSSVTDLIDGKHTVTVTFVK
jgi:hypothetical protein